MAWYDDLISWMQWPNTAVNRQALQLWAASEGMPDNANNWLAVSTYGIGANPPPAPYSEPFYDTEPEGIVATAEFLGGSNYDEVRRFFAIGTNLVDIYLAINESPWCCGETGGCPDCQGGHYPIQLYDAVAPDLASGGTDVTPAPGFTPQTLMATWWADMADWITSSSAEVNAVFAEAQALFESL